MGKRVLIEIGESVFTTKKDALAFYKEILNSYKPGEEINNEDFDLVFNLLRIHPNSAEKIGVGIEKIVVEQDAYKTICFHVLRKDNTKENFSYIKCINGESNDFTKFSKACRKAVEKDLKEIKQDYFKENSKEGKVKCQETKESIQFEDAHVDHRQPNTFSVIVDRFIEVNKIQLQSVSYTSIENYGHEFTDKQLAESFRDYHKLKANLRVVKKSRNLARSFQGRITSQKKDLRIK